MINDDAMQKKKKEYLLVSHSWVLQKKSLEILLFRK